MDGTDREEQKLILFVNMSNHNTYMTSVLQALYNIEVLEEYFIPYVQHLVEPKYTKTLLDEFVKIYADSYNSGQRKIRYDTSRICRIYEHKSGEERQIQDFFYDLVSSIDRSLLGMEKQKVDVNLQSMFMQRIRTTVNDMTVREWTLMLRVPVDSGYGSLDDWLDDWQKPCEIAGSRVQHFFDKTESVICFLFDIFSYDQDHSSKTPVRMRIPEILTINDDTYILRSVIAHHGISVQKGGFVTFFRVKSSDVWLVSDQYLPEMTKEFDHRLFFEDQRYDRYPDLAANMVFYEREKVSVIDSSVL